MIGFSPGACYAPDLPVADPERVHFAVVFHGPGDGDFARSRAACLRHFANMDAYEPQAGADGLGEVLWRAGRPLLFCRCGGTGHRVRAPDGPQAFNQAAASLAWGRTSAFLSRTITL